MGPESNFCDTWFHSSHNLFTASDLQANFSLFFFMMFLFLSATNSSVLLVCPIFFLHDYHSYICFCFSRSSLYIQPCILATVVLFPSGKICLCWLCTYQVSPISPTSLLVLALPALCHSFSLNPLGDLGLGEEMSSACPLLPCLQTVAESPDRVT